MKKLFLALILMFFIQEKIYASDENINITFEGNTTNGWDIFIEDNRTFISLEDLSKVFDIYTIINTHNANTIIMQKRTTEILFLVDKQIFTVQGMEMPEDVIPIFKDKWYVPLRRVMEGFRYDVLWDVENNSINIGGSIEELYNINYSKMGFLDSDYQKVTKITSISELKDFEEYCISKAESRNNDKLPYIVEYKQDFFDDKFIIYLYLREGRSGMVEYRIGSVNIDEDINITVERICPRSVSENGAAHQIILELDKIFSNKNVVLDVEKITIIPDPYYWGFGTLDFKK